jgi:RNA polymerase sigma factor (sigma-70 family)
MATNQLSRFIQTIRDATFHHHEAGLTDAQLLERYVRSREDVAFAALVHRHGPMVWGVCRRVLRSHQDAEDAFQATFLVLVRKAASLVSRELVANWLYGVAQQTALKARATTARRGMRERQVSAMPEPVVERQELRDDLQALLDQELACLPDRYRAVIVLCDLEWQTRKEVAAHLHLPEGTVASRLATARAMLAKRLARHGLPVSAVALAAVLAATTASASVPRSVTLLTSKAASLLTAGQTATAGVIPARVAVLAGGVLKTMLLNKLPKVKVALLVVFGTVALAAGLANMHTALAQQGQTKKPPASDHEARDSSSKQAERPKPKDAPLGMKFVPLPRGTFYMGWNGTQKGVKTEIKEDFEIAAHTVTQEQWQAVMGNNPSDFSRDGDEKDKVKDIKDGDLKQFPVEMVSWEDTQQFLKKLNEQEKGKGWLYRLPTEAEWEYACRGGATSEEECSFNYYFAKPTNDLSSKQANFVGEHPFGKADKGPFLGRPTKVGSYPPNRLGLYDMHGNVWQWCGDIFVGDHRRVSRGGSWNLRGITCQAAKRYLIGAIHSSNNRGFRLARVPVR